MEEFEEASLVRIDGQAHVETGSPPGPRQQALKVKISIFKWAQNHTKSQWRRQSSGEAAITIQKWWRGTLVRRSLQHAIICAWLVQKWWRKVSFQRQEEKRLMALSTYIWSEKASVLLQSMFKMWLMRTRYKKYQRAAQIIQSNWRLHSFRKTSDAYSLNKLNQDGIDLNIEIVVE
ncbi:IQ domain-containing protein F6 [Zootoca vivipara]|uniref:IQ domain-containing protein F6 n=1 Tax=Zootoca vivipara TaxID=8524 RepID=UPI00159255D1|nr:IQ domain-containing protein F6 [Zootoca vivipara]